MRFFHKQKGAVSVFLTLVLIPVMIFGLLTTDAAKIYSAKVVISDSGELAMNAALAQYEDKLFDQYGLLGMSKTPESMEGDLEKYFINTLNSSGISGAGSYEEMLGLLQQKFDAINVSNTEVYRTEVEKQQILEYMKYRAPVCLTELVLEKLDFIKDSKQLLDAMNKEMDFAEAMEDCQDAFKEALVALDALNTTIESFPTEQDMNDELAHTQMDITTTVARCLLMRAAIQDYSAKPSGRSLKEMMRSYITHADRVDLRNPYSSDSYSNYLDSVYYYNGISEAGGAGSLGGDSEPPDKEEDPEGYAEWQAENEANAELIAKYNRARDRVSGYMQTLLNCANSYVTTHYNTLNGYYTLAETGAKQAKDAWDKLENARQKLLQATNEYDKWDKATYSMDEKLRGDMDEQVEKYRDFFGDDLQSLALLQTKVDQDKDFFSEIRDLLKKETEFTVSIATTSPSSQINTYGSKARTAVSGNSKDYNELEHIRHESFEMHYNHIVIENSDFTYMVRIHDDPFYLKLQEYCQENETEESESRAKEGNDNLDKGAESAEDAQDDSGFPTYDWSSASQPLPSVKLGLASYTQASTTLTDLDSGNNVKKKSSRRNIISKMKDSINEAQSFLDGVDRIIANNLENLYIAEYAMQMFSHYTCEYKMQKNKELKKLSDDENISISGYKLSQNKAYKAEIEYILWGNKSSVKNVLSTMMLLFGIRLLFNSIYVFTDQYVDVKTSGYAAAIAGPAPYLEPIIKVALKFGLAAVETGIDMSRLSEGYGVAIFKTAAAQNFETMNKLNRGDVRNGVTFDYGEYLRVFLNIQMIAGKEENVLARIGDCVQVNTETDITEDYTMVEVQADVGVKTIFMRRIADWSSSDWEYGDSYTVKYKSILGY